MLCERLKLTALKLQDPTVHHVSALSDTSFATFNKLNSKRMSGPTQN